MNLSLSSYFLTRLRFILSPHPHLNHIIYLIAVVASSCMLHDVVIYVCHTTPGMVAPPFSFHNNVAPPWPRRKNVILITLSVLHDNIIISILISNEHHGRDGTNLRPRRIPIESKIMETYCGESSSPTSGGTGIL